VEGIPNKSLGVAICDFNDDGWLDIAVANDGQPNNLFRNQKNGTFYEEAAELGFAYNAQGNTRGGMGIDAGDINHSNRDSFVIGNFDDEMIGLYYNQGANFVDMAPSTQVGTASKTFSIFGCLFIDVDNDGWLDIFTASGHIDEHIEGIRGASYKLRPLLFHNRQQELFKEIGATAGPAMQKPQVGRGLAAADIDLDGDEDLVLTTNNGLPVLLQNQTQSGNNVIRLTLQGNKSNRSAIGTLVKVNLGDTGLRRRVKSGSSYLSQNELPLTLGLGQRKNAQRITVYWPSGKKTVLLQEAANQMIWINEAQGVVKRQPFLRRPH